MQSKLGGPGRYAEVWAKLLHNDLGFENEPNVEMRTLGMSKYTPNISWEAISRLRAENNPADDQTRVALAEHGQAFGGLPASGATGLPHYFR